MGTREGFGVGDSAGAESRDAPQTGNGRALRLGRYGRRCLPGCNGAPRGTPAGRTVDERESAEREDDRDRDNERQRGRAREFRDAKRTRDAVQRREHSTRTARRSQVSRRATEVPFHQNAGSLPVDRVLEHSVEVGRVEHPGALVGWEFGHVRNTSRSDHHIDTPTDPVQSGAQARNCQCHTPVLARGDDQAILPARLVAAGDPQVLDEGREPLGWEPAEVVFDGRRITVHLSSMGSDSKD
ncbi:hypothetical protein BRC83_10625 [Halobacteriales archaeon QS_1_68_17]|nr:MAG: hypothetical protein BRC83_10625 [Halobacteriales archaeon QS_1_68_17]